MTIRYANGKTIDGIVLSQHGGCIRAAVQDCEDVVEFTAENGVWSSEDREPVRLKFAWERHASNDVVSEALCICPKELASVLIQSLRGDGEGHEFQVDPPKVISMGASFLLTDGFFAVLLATSTVPTRLGLLSTSIARASS